jgi:hypothetical protein
LLFPLAYARLTAIKTNASYHIEHITKVISLQEIGKTSIDAYTVHFGKLNGTKKPLSKSHVHILKLSAKFFFFAS